jgi:hypothetical protein
MLGFNSMPKQCEFLFEDNPATVHRWLQTLEDKIIS